jgi:hypothetical protein
MVKYKKSLFSVIKQRMSFLPVHSVRRTSCTFDVAKNLEISAASKISRGHRYQDKDITTKVSIGISFAMFPTTPFQVQITTKSVYYNPRRTFNTMATSKTQIAAIILSIHIGTPSFDL